MSVVPGHIMIEQLNLCHIGLHIINMKLIQEYIVYERAER